MKKQTNLISQNLTAMRQYHKYSQEEVAEKVGVTRQAVAKWESEGRSFFQKSTGPFPDQAGRSSCGTGRRKSRKRRYRFGARRYRPAQYRFSARYAKR